jgi:hypothetical protein
MRVKCLPSMLSRSPVNNADSPQRRVGNPENKLCFQFSLAVASAPLRRPQIYDLIPLITLDFVLNTLHIYYT